MASVASVSKSSQTFGESNGKSAIFVNVEGAPLSQPEDNSPYIVLARIHSRKQRNDYKQNYEHR